MVAAKEQTMGRFSVEVELSNQKDLFASEAHIISPDQVRSERVRGVVDSGAARLVIPESVVQRLGLDIEGSVQVRYADGRTAQRSVARNVRLSFGGRDGVFSAIVEPARDSALIGAIVLEELDLLVDCTQGRLVPRDPKHIISEIE